MLSKALIRRNAAELARKGPVTNVRLAKRLNVRLRTLNAFIKNNNGFESEIALVSERKKFLWAIEKLENAGVLVLTRRIARITQATEPTVRSWVTKMKRRGRTEVQSVIPHDIVALHHIVRRVKWLQRLARAAGKKYALNKSQIARDIERERTSLIRTIRRFPAFGEDLGLGQRRF